MNTAAKNLMNDTVAGSGAFLTSPETCLEVAKYALEAAAERMKSKTKTVGNIVTADTIMSYSLSYGHVVTVSGKQDAERDLWEFAGTIDGKVVIRGEVLGGKWRASTYLKFVRNGLLSRARRHKVNPAAKTEGGEE